MERRIFSGAADPSLIPIEKNETPKNKRETENKNPFLTLFLKIPPFLFLYSRKCIARREVVIPVKTGIQGI
jgi:hypothetical protein